MKSVPSISPTLQGTRVRLRALRAEDADALVEVSFYDGVPADSPATARAMLARIAEDQARGETIHWGIEDAAGALCGTIGFYRGFPEDVGEVGYVLRPAWRGHGLMTEALGVAVRYGYEGLELASIVAHTEASNPASIAVLERCGFHHAATVGSRRTYVRPR